jgi:hypothetical protein
VTQTVEETQEQTAARASLREKVGGVQEALSACADAGLDAQAEIMQMISEAFAAQGEGVPPMLKMLLG